MGQWAQSSAFSPSLSTCAHHTQSVCTCAETKQSKPSASCWVYWLMGERPDVEIIQELHRILWNSEKKNGSVISTKKKNSSQSSKSRVKMPFFWPFRIPNETDFHLCPLREVYPLTVSIPVPGRQLLKKQTFTTRGRIYPSAYISDPRPLYLKGGGSKDHQIIKENQVFLNWIMNIIQMYNVII